MHSEVSVTFDNQQVFRFDLEHQPPIANELARRWLDDEFTTMQSEPLRASGKLLLADKVVVVAHDAGPRRFADPVWGLAFAQAARAALGKKIVRVDVTTLSVSY